MNTKSDKLKEILPNRSHGGEAFKKLGLGLAGMALACFWVANWSQASTPTTGLKVPAGPGHPIASCTQDISNPE